MPKVVPYLNTPWEVPESSVSKLIILDPQILVSIPVILAMHIGQEGVTYTSVSAQYSIIGHVNPVLTTLYELAIGACQPASVNCRD